MSVIYSPELAKRGYISAASISTKLASLPERLKAARGIWKSEHRKVLKGFREPLGVPQDGRPSMYSESPHEKTPQSLEDPP